MTPGRSDAENTSPLTAAYLLTFTPEYLLESLQEIAPLVDKCLIVLLYGGINAAQLLHQAKMVLGDKPVDVHEGSSSYIDGVNAAFRYAQDGWLLILESDECVEREEFARALQCSQRAPGKRYNVDTQFFWHDSSHIVDGAAWQRAGAKTRLWWVTPGQNLNNQGQINLADGAMVPAAVETGNEWIVLNYAHVCNEETMRQRVGNSHKSANTKNPADWFSPWWQLGVNRVPQEVKKYRGKHPAALSYLNSKRAICDRDQPVPSYIDKPLVWEGWIGQEISYGVITDYTVRYLETHGWEPHVRPVDLLGPVGSVPPETRRAIQRESERRESLRRHKNLIVVKNSHTNDWMQLQYVNAEVKIGYSPHERVALEPPDVLRANKMDFVMVTSSYVQKVFEASGVKRPFYVYHHGYNPQYLRPFERPERPEFTFLAVTVLNLRKGPDLLLNAFAQEFTKENDVRLIVKTSPHVWHEDLHKQLISHYGNHPKIKFLHQHHTEAELAQLYYDADCFVLPTRAEGFGMPILEAMATGLPVIVTNFSGHLDFCTPENSYLIDVDNHDQLEFVMGCEAWWAAPNEQHLGELMRHAYENCAETRKRGRQAALDVANWTWENQVAKLSRFFKQL